MSWYLDMPWVPMHALSTNCDVRYDPPPLAQHIFRVATEVLHKNRTSYRTHPTKYRIIPYIFRNKIPYIPYILLYLYRTYQKKNLLYLYHTHTKNKIMGLKKLWLREAAIKMFFSSWPWRTFFGGFPYVFKQAVWINLLYWNDFYGLEREKKYRIWFLPTSGISSCVISQGKIISVNWLLCYRFFHFNSAQNLHFTLILHSYQYQ